METAPDFVMVLSLERTGGTSVFQSLKAAVGQAPLAHLHFFDSDRYRGASDTPAKAAARATKREREIQAKALLDDESLNRVIFTVMRDPFGRLVSSLWFTKRDLLMRSYDAARDSFEPRALEQIQHRIALVLEKEAGYGREVYEPLGLPARPAPGRYRTKGGARVYALDFARLGEDFGAATAEVFGKAYPLVHVNGGAMIGDAKGYAAFKRYCAEVLTPERLTKVS